MQQALAVRADRDIEVQWLPFELNSAMPIEGRNRREYLLERFGRPDPFAAGQQQLLELGRSMGIAFDFEAIERAPNTRRAHALAAAAWRSSPPLQAKVIKALVVAYFTEGRNIGDPAVLEKIGIKAGMTAEAAAAALDDAGLHAEIVSLEALAQRSQITGVPTFVFDRRHSFSGAQPLESFLQVIDALTSPAQ